MKTHSSYPFSSSTIGKAFLEGFDDDLDYRKIQRISELLIMDVLQFLRKIEEVFEVGEEENSDNKFYTFEMKSIQEKLPKHEAELKAEDRKIRQEMEREKKERERYEKGSE